VELSRDLPSFVRGTRGVVVLVYPSGKQVEVEFLNPKGDTLGVESVPMAFLRKVPRAPKPKAAPRKVSSQELSTPPRQKPRWGPQKSPSTAPT
jgi:hypothetical protein